MKISAGTTLKGTNVKLIRTQLLQILLKKGSPSVER